VAAVEAGDLPRCGCGRLLRPDVVWFGELLNPLHLQRIGAFMERGADLVLVIGTSGEVSGGYGIVEFGSERGARVVEINPHPSHLSADADLVLRAPAGELLARVWPQVTAAGR
jgi:NAD-dependent deacetylase